MTVEELQQAQELLGGIEPFIAGTKANIEAMEKAVEIYRNFITEQLKKARVPTND